MPRFTPVTWRGLSWHTGEGSWHMSQQFAKTVRHGVEYAAMLEHVAPCRGG